MNRMFSSTSSAGLAIKDFWNVDDRTIVFVADPTFGKGVKLTFSHSSVMLAYIFQI